MNDFATNWSPLLAQGDTRVFYQWMRLEQLDQWHHWFILALCIAAILSYVVYWYRRDWNELPKSIGWALLALRMTALLGILIFFLDLQKRTEQRVTRPSKLAVLVDTSLSMTMPEQDESDGQVGADGGSSAVGGTNRITAVQRAFGQSRLLHELRNRHDVQVYGFDKSAKPTAVASFSKPRGTQVGSDESNQTLELWALLARVAWIGTWLMLVSLVAMIMALVIRAYGNRHPGWPYVILGSIVGLGIGFILVATSILRADQIAWRSLWSSSPQSLAPQSAATVVNDTSVNPVVPNNPDAVAWETSLAATGTESRLGDAISSVLSQERGAPLAGIVVFSDGRSNAGTDPLATISDAALQGVPIHTVGLGTEKNPINVRLIDIEAPKRVFPGDRFRLNALVQASGLQGRSITVQLRRRSGGQKNSGMAIEEERVILLGADDAITSLAFDIQPREVGSWIYEVKAIPPSQDTNAFDNALESEVRVVEPKSTVLIIAGGPTREYQFVRNLLFRDATVQSHVYLQSGRPGVSQESKKLLTEFPKTREALSEYDCIISFDADWSALATEEVENVEKWISEQAGGLVIVAGPIGTPKWAGSQGNGNRKAEILRNLCPLVVNSRGARMVSLGRFESEKAWHLKFANDAWRTDFIQVAATLAESQNAWDRFLGVYSFYACYEPKPGATPIAYFSDPSTNLLGSQPVYLATQLYGAGRVGFQGGGEFWRMREVGENYFDTYYTKLIRWAGQGRLLRDSDRGMLLLDKQQAIVGEQVLVRALLRDVKFQPVTVAEVQTKLVDPKGRSTSLKLSPIPDPSQPGVYAGQFFTKMTGTYEVQLPVGGLADQQLLTQQVSVRVPALEIQRPQRNDALLGELASRTGGRYWLGLQSISEVNQRDTSTPATPADSSDVSIPPNQPRSMVAAIEPRDQTNYLPGASDREFQQRLMGLLMAWITGSLCLEWLIRRLSRLA